VAVDPKKRARIRLERHFTRSSHPTPSDIRRRSESPTIESNCSDIYKSFPYNKPFMSNEADTCRKMDPILRMQTAYDIVEAMDREGDVLA